MNMPPSKNPRIPKAVLSRLPALENCATPLTKCLWALKARKESSGSQAFISADDISEILLNSDVSLTPVRVQRALARAGDAVARRRVNRTPLFRVMGPGEKVLLRQAAGDGLHAIYISGTAPWSDRRLVVSKAVATLTGHVRIVDKFFGVESLDFLHAFARTRRISFLTEKLSGDVGHLRREVSRFRKEFPNSEFRIYPRKHELHDRYLVSDREVWLIGHGIKDFGSKESFVVVLKDPFGKDLRSILRDSFDQRWVVSTAL